MSNNAHLTFVGTISSPFQNPDECPRQGREGGARAVLTIHEEYHEALLGAAPGKRLVLLTWLDRADRDTRVVHPQNNPENPLTGVFLTRSPHRPNPIGLHEVEIVDIQESGTLIVEPLEAADGTPVVDIKNSWHEG